jgi:hypothetical protein
MRLKQGLLLTATLLAVGAARFGAGDAGDVIKWVGQGDQAYTCRGTAAHYEWVPDGPTATLIDEYGRKRGTHGKGPSWRAEDGSMVFGQPIMTIPAPKPDTVPWLVLRASSREGNGILADVRYILRTDTVGGAAPAGGCDSAHAGLFLRVPYRALYSFIPAPGAGEGIVNRHVPQMPNPAGATAGAPDAAPKTGPSAPVNGHSN